MTNYIIRRLLLVPVLLIGVTLIIFGMLQLLGPVERSALYVRDFPKNEKQIEGLIRKYGLDRPFFEQYWRWLNGVIDPGSGERRGGILYGDFGYSRTASQPVVDLVKERFPNTVDLALWTIYPMLSVGIWLGVKAAVNQNKFIDQAARMYSIIGTSFPVFVFGLLLLMFMYAKTGWFYPGKMSDWVSKLIFSGQLKQYTHLLTIDALLNLRFDVFWDALRHMIMPIITLSYINWATFVRVTRSSMLETLRQDYVVTARQRPQGNDVINKHARRTRCCRSSDGWLQHCRPAGRRGNHGDCLQLPRHRQGLRRRGSQPGRCDHPGSGHLYRHYSHPLEPDCGHHLRVHRSARTIGIRSSA